MITTIETIVDDSDILECQYMHFHVITNRSLTYILSNEDRGLSF